MNLFSILSVCENVAILKLLYFIRTLLDLVLFAIPIGVVVMVMLDFGKNVIAGKEDEMKKNLNIAIKRLIYSVVIFLVPTIVEFAINGLGEFNVDYKSCFYVTLDEIDKMETEQKAKCTGEYEWNEDLYMCLKKETNTGNSSSSGSVVVGENKSSSGSNSSSSGGSSSGSSGGSSTITGKVPTGKKKLIYYNQGLYQDISYCSGSQNLRRNGCGAVSLAMMASTFTSGKYEPIYVADWMCGKDADEGKHKGGGTPWSYFTMPKMLDKFDLVVEVLFKKANEDGSPKKDAGRTYNEEEGAKILKAVRLGKGIILYIPGHYVAVGPNPDCSSNQVYLYDVGGRANNGCYTPKELFAKTYNNKNRCTNNDNCGWKAAWAYNGK